MWSHGIVIPKTKVQIINRKLVGVSGGRGTAQHLCQRARVSRAGGSGRPQHHGDTAAAAEGRSSTSTGMTSASRGCCSAPTTRATPPTRSAIRISSQRPGRNVSNLSRWRAEVIVRTSHVRWSGQRVAEERYQHSDNLITFMCATTCEDWIRG